MSEIYQHAVTMSGLSPTMFNCSNCSGTGDSYQRDKGLLEVSDMIDLFPNFIAALLCTFVLFVLFKSNQVRSDVGSALALIANAVLGDLFNVVVVSFNEWLYHICVPYGADTHQQDHLRSLLLFLVWRSLE